MQRQACRRPGWLPARLCQAGVLAEVGSRALAQIDRHRLPAIRGGRPVARCADRGGGIGVECHPATAQARRCGDRGSHDRSGILVEPMTVPPSRLQLPPGPWRTVLEALCARFPRIPESQWRERFLRGRVLDQSGAPLPLDAPYRPGAQVQYFREVAAEPALPGGEYVVHSDADLLVAFKPHFLPVAPT